MYKKNRDRKDGKVGFSGQSQCSNDPIASTLCFVDAIHLMLQNGQNALR